MADTQYRQGTVYREIGGAREVVSSGASLDVESGAELDIESGGALKLAGTAISATAAEINQACDVSANIEVVAATNVITAAESGATFFLAASTEFASTLPAVTNAGARYKFIVSAAPSGASYTVAAASGTTIVGQILTNDFSGTTDSAFSATGVATITFVDAKSVKGDWVEVISDGTNWYVTGACSVFDAITLS